MRKKFILSSLVSIFAFAFCTIFCSFSASAADIVTVSSTSCPDYGGSCVNIMFDAIKSNPNYSKPHLILAVKYFNGNPAMYFFYRNSDSAVDIPYIVEDSNVVLDFRTFPSEQRFTYEIYTMNSSRTASSSSSGGSSTTYERLYTPAIYVVESTLQSVSFNGVEYVDTSVIKPFEVSVTPDLFVGMNGSTISYPSKSGGTVTDTLYPIKLDVTLTDEFIERFGNSLIYDDGYSFTCFVVPTDYVSEDIDSMCAHSIYNYTYYGKFTNDSYENTFNVNSGNSSLLHPADGSLTASPDTSQFWHVGEGWTNIASVSCSSPSRPVSLDATSIDFANHPATSYNIVIHACKAPTDLRFAGVPSTWYYNNVSEHHFKQTGTIVSTEGEETEYYMQYTWVSDPFKYSTDPYYFPSTYEAELNEKGQTAQTNPFAFSRSPSVVWDDALMYATDSNGNTNGTNVKGYSIDEWNKILQERQWSANFNSDYNVGNVTDVLNGSSSFFGFLTASIAVLPSWFMTILTSFFVTLLAIAVLKFLF